MTQRNQPMEIDEILRMALAKEKSAHQFYSRMLMERRAEIVRNLLEQLKDEEYKHIRMVETMIAKLEMGKQIV